MRPGHDAVHDVSATRVRGPVARGKLRVVSHSEVAGGPSLDLEVVSEVLLRCDIVLDGAVARIRDLSKVRVSSLMTPVELPDGDRLLDLKAIAKVRLGNNKVYDASAEGVGAEHGFKAGVSMVVTVQGNGYDRFTCVGNHLWDVTTPTVRVLLVPRHVRIRITTSTIRLTNTNMLPSTAINQR